MQIHVVQRGQSLFGISQAYSVSWQAISRANELSDPGRLAVGQALVIPIDGRYHWVQPGQSLYSISRMYGMNMNELAQINRISLSTPLQIGLRLYIPPRPKTTIDVLAYIEPRETVSQVLINEVRNHGRNMTYLAIFSYQINENGTLTAPTIDDLPSIARSLRVMPTMVVSNLRAGNFRPELATAIFTNTAASDRLIANIIQTAQNVGYGDIHFDFELLRPEDRERYNAFLRKARDRFHAVGLTISTAIGPKTGPTTTGIYAAHDYDAHGEITDFTALMTYEWGYAAGDPQAISPIGPVRQVVNYALQHMPPSKILLGQNLYAYDWTAPYPSAGGPPARALSIQGALNLAIEENAQIIYDYTAQAPYFNYIDDEGKTHTVWFEDARSIQAKFDLIKQYNLRGIMYWKLGLSFPQNWLLLADNFNVRKRV